MIRCKLSTLLGERRLKVADVCRATGVSRATLDRYYYRANLFYPKNSSFRRKPESRFHHLIRLLILIRRLNWIPAYPMPE
ncbi:MAG: helix-turn-helix transcriptional regulator [Gammaproteobacteria bacterium]|nr:helix-turn-helix transcriptional regulator [Gammaproteobacteria bacterium]